MISYLEKLASEKREFPPLLFLGPKGSGKKMAAVQFFQRILGQTVIENHPDYRYFDFSQFNDVKSVRELLNDMKLSPLIAKYRLFILDNFEMITEEGANAMLKTLEEPSKSSRIVILSNNRNIPETVVSRCVVVSFYGDLKPEDAFSIEKQKLLSVYRAGLLEKMLLINEYGQKDSEELRQIFESILTDSREILLKDPLMHVFLQRLIASLNMFNQNIHKKLILQKVFL